MNETKNQQAGSSSVPAAGTEGVATATQGNNQPSQQEVPARPASPEISRRSPTPEGPLSKEFSDRLTSGDKLAGTLLLIQRFLEQKQVPNTPKSIGDLFPDDWRVGNTPIPTAGHQVVVQAMRAMIPVVRAFNSDGDEVKWVGRGRDLAGVSRLTAEWAPPVMLVAGILSAVRKRKVEKDTVLEVAQQSPQALEKLKEAGKALKTHFQRLLDPVAQRRSPEFNRTAQQYKARLRTLIDEQQRVILEARRATRMVNQLLGERDEALSRLDPGYVAKRKSAAAALAQFGIDLDGEEMAALEDNVSKQALDDLDF
jgi:hypothetical protein